MSPAILTRHAGMRMAQRCIREQDLELAMRIGTEVEGGVFVREKDCEELERAHKRRIQQLRRLSGLRIVVADGWIVTSYRANRRKQRTLLRG